ncbi:MAG: response regulator transcription factor [Clostridium sp.]
MKKRVLIADDEKEIIELLSLYLEKDFEIIEAYDGEMALRKLTECNVDIALIDIMMPKLNGFQLVKKLRGEFKIPVIMISAKNDYSDKILGLDLGADDYISKPFNPLEVVARVKAQLRRINELSVVDNGNEEFIEFGELKLDTLEYRLYKNEENIPITSTEYKILWLFMREPGRVYTKKQIFEQVWDEVYFGDDNTIMVHMSRIREKIEEDPRQPKYLKTIRGIGYKMERAK